jgi:hypothetical protein
MISREARRNFWRRLDAIDTLRSCCGLAVNNGGQGGVPVPLEACEFDIDWSVASSGCDFCCGGNLQAIRSRGRGANDEWPVKVFNSSVENRVEKDYCESKTAEKKGVMHFAQVVCSSYCSRKILAWAF